MHQAEQGRVFPGSRLLSLGTDTSIGELGSSCVEKLGLGCGVHPQADGRIRIWSQAERGHKASVVITLLTGN